MGKNRSNVKTVSLLIVCEKAQSSGSRESILFGYSALEEMRGGGGFKDGRCC